MPLLYSTWYATLGSIVAVVSTFGGQGKPYEVRPRGWGWGSGMWRDQNGKGIGTLDGTPIYIREIFYLLR